MDVEPNTHRISDRTDVREIRRDYCAAAPKGALDDATLMALLGGYGDDQDAVERAWEAWERDRDEVALTAAIGASTRAMDALKQT